MNKEQAKLVAAYLAGEKVEQALIEACEVSPTFAAELASDVAFERIVKYHYVATSNEQFLADFEQKLSSEKSPVIRGNFTRQVLALCASLLAVVLLSWYVFIPPNEVGKLVKVTGAAQPEELVLKGNELQKGLFHLPQGYAELLLNNGVVLVLEAPLKLDIKSPDLVILHEGRLVARVPEQATGFTVNTPQAEIIDLGTEFGVSVDKSGESQLHVIQGEVKVRANQQLTYEHLVASQGRMFKGEQQVSIIQSQPHLFMRTLPGRSLDAPEYLHWSFDKPVEQGFTCHGAGIQGQCYPALHQSLGEFELASYQIAGKFGKGLRFDGQNNWIDTEFKGIEGNKPRTVAMWVKVPKTFSINHGYGIVSWGLPEQLSAWQISPNPSERLGPLGRIRIGTNQAEIIGTTDLRDDEWHHIAVVLFGGEHANLATHVLIYVDGKLEKTSVKSIAKVSTQLGHQDSQPLRMGRNIAYKNLDNLAQRYRFFKGGIDEVFVFDSALDQLQINHLMRTNRITK